MTTRRSQPHPVGDITDQYGFMAAERESLFCYVDSTACPASADDIADQPFWSNVARVAGETTTDEGVELASEDTDDRSVRR